MNDLEIYDLGSSIIIEVEFKRYSPHVGYAYFNPDPAKITVTDSAGTKKVDNEALLPYATGKFYYKIQTIAVADPGPPAILAWLTGAYKVQVDATDDPDTDITITPGVFQLK